MNNDRAGAARRQWEWVGCFAVWTWGYCLVNSFEPWVAEEGAIMPILVMLLVASVAATMLGCGSKPKKLSTAAMLAAPVGMVATAAMTWLPDSGFLLLYAISLLCLGPVLVRRTYGLIQVYDLDREAWAILSIFLAGFIFHAAWSLLPTSFEVKFAILAVLGAGSLWRVREVSLWRVSDPGYSPPESRSRSLQQKVLFLSYVASLVIADITCQMLMVSMASKAAAFPIAWLAATVISGAVMAFGGVVTGTDSGRGWLVIGVAATCAGLIASFVSDDPDLDYIVLFTCSLGAGTALMLLLTLLPTVAPNRMLDALFASIGSVWVAVRCAFLILFRDQMPFMQQGRPPVWLLVAALLSMAALLVISFVLLMRTETTNLIVAVMRLMSISPKQRRSVESLVSELNQSDRRMLALFADGQSRSKIADELSMPMAQLNERIAAIRRSITDPASEQRADVLALIAERHSLTAREVEMVEDICDGKANAQIAAERFVTERTVKFHVGNVLSKLNVTNRREVRQLIDRANDEVQRSRRASDRQADAE